MDEFTEAAIPTDTEIDTAWDETEATGDDWGEGEQATSQPDADQPAADETPETADETKPTETEDKQEDKPAEADPLLTFTLKHLDEVRTVDKDEIVKLAQQGMDYERIRTERDQLRDYRKEADPALALVKEVAAENGMTIEQYADYFRKQKLMATGLDEKNATERLALDKEKEQQKATEEAKATEEQQKQAATREQEQKAEAKRNDMGLFLKKYPTIKPDAIPKEVWIDVASGVPLVAAYTEHRNKQLETELAAERQNKANAQKTTGSKTTAGAGHVDEYDKWWNSD